MDLDTIGWQQYSDNLPEVRNIPLNTVARVAVENRNNYLLYSTHGDLQGIVRGKLLHMAKQDGDLPKVGDWVIIEKLPNEAKAIIASILPRTSSITRQGVDENHQQQVIAANVDVLFIVQSLDSNFNLRRLERYLLMARAGGCRPVIVLNKSDLSEQSPIQVASVQQMAPDVLTIPVSAKTGLGLDQLQAIIKPGMTVAFVGSSGVGKSTLINALVGQDIQAIGEVRLVDSKGRHTTTKREIVLLPTGGVLIDTPGMRELEVLASEESLGDVFADIEELTHHCRYTNCDHKVSEGCAVIAAIASGQLEKKRYDSFLKLKSGLGFHSSKTNKPVYADRNKRSKKVKTGGKKVMRGKQ